jgi:hypothetical protein
MSKSDRILAKLGEVIGLFQTLNRPLTPEELARIDVFMALLVKYHPVVQVFNPENEEAEDPHQARQHRS